MGDYFVIARRLKLPSFQASFLEFESCCHFAVASKWLTIQTRFALLDENELQQFSSGWRNKNTTKLGLILTKLGQFSTRGMLIWKSIRQLNLIKHFVNIVKNFKELKERYRSQFTWNTNFLALWNVFTTAVVLYLRLSFGWSYWKWFQCVINKELHVIFGQFGMNSPR